MEEKPTKKRKGAEKPWVKEMGKLKYLRKETGRVSRLIEKDSEKIDVEMWR
ncbi:MAG: hypothetical protein ACRD8A_15780 [Candidatus Acidiferrales bacterium]